MTNAELAIGIRKSMLARKLIRYRRMSERIRCGTNPHDRTLNLPDRIISGPTQKPKRGNKLQTGPSA